MNNAIVREQRYQSQKGLTLIELIVVIGIMTVLFTLSTINLTPLLPKAHLNTSVDQIISEIKSQQTKSMPGTTVSNVLVEHGIKFDTSAFIMFDSAVYSATNAGNFAVPVSDEILITTTFPQNEVVFALGSGEIVNATASHTITLNDQTTQEQRVITINPLGVITSVE